MPAPGPDKPLCGAQLPNRPPGKTCRQVAGARTSHLHIGRCWRHGGATTAHVVAAQHQRVTDAAAIMGVPTGVDPHDGMLKMLAVAYGQELWLRDESALLERSELTGPVGGGEHAHPRYEPNVLVRMHQDAVDRVAKIAKQCADAGVAKRTIELQEGMAAMVAQVLRAYAVARGEDVQDPGVRQAMRQALLSIEAPVIEGEGTT